jgi:hypothetical protein
MAKIFKNLYDQIHHPLNLWVTHMDAAGGKRYMPAMAFFVKVPRKEEKTE